LKSIDHVKAHAILAQPWKHAKYLAFEAYSPMVEDYAKKLYTVDSRLTCQNWQQIATDC